MRDPSKTGILAGIALATVTLVSACGKPAAPEPPAAGTGTPVAPALQRWQKSTHALIFIAVKGKSQTLKPDSTYLWIGAGGSGAREVWFLFVHKEAKISWKSGNPSVLPDPMASCSSLGPGKVTACSVVIPGSAHGGTYKYSVTGKNDADETLDSIDPEVEIDR